MGTKSMGTKLDQNMPIIDIIKIQISDFICKMVNLLSFLFKKMKSQNPFLKFIF